MINKIDKNFLATRFGNSCDGYENATPTQEKMAQALMQRITQRFAGREIFSILELGCGTGRLTRQLISAFPKAEITAIDISADMVAHAYKAVPQAEYIEADAEKFIFLTEKKFDLIVSNATIQWFEKADAALRRIYELLAPQGFMAIGTFANRTFHELTSTFNKAYSFNGLKERQHTVPMRSINEWRGAIPNAEIFDEIIERNFPDVISFLRSIQEAGAVNSLTNRFAIPKSVLRNMKEYYAKDHSNAKTGEILATYHVCYIFCDKTPH